ncbi:hypothetical protein R078138_00328 [Convivina praedatoris]|uniref:Uncharacterized protein n=1 Tax=Convivina praedatoris TaxID=2880963 RepID=A0ABM9D1M6_9LACO|nr:hypothetical protein R077815_00002 [Convivina sp. LMG 32447]CAH1849884.1 hypothetical protein LMG032447_00004 [Convivina sp. LMG 32447]CAH1851355.1 hypothetical protein R078138_00328 [Convivina sp. LMG 32447]
MVNTDPAAGCPEVVKRAIRKLLGEIKVTCEYQPTKTTDVLLV